ncbi:hypothetical protein TSUD_413540, partial [Trifolium subterraneum]
VLAPRRSTFAPGRRQNEAEAESGMQVRARAQKVRAGAQATSISRFYNSSLLSPFSIEEVREVVWSSDGNKCPGPDGFNFNFLKTCWDIIKTDVMEFLNEFHSSDSLPKAITASFLTLVPKKDHPQKAVDNGNYHGFKVRDDLQFHTLQFADDTVLVGEGNWENLWSLKTVLRSFELVSGLKVNFFKSKLYGINLDDNFLSAASSFLHCEVDSIPFRFLGIPVGANPRRKITWNPVVEAMKKRLNAWNCRNLSIGGKVTLINSVLSSLPLYFFSFFKVPVCVLQDLINIQRRFLWGGRSDIKKICWVSWDTICLPKDKGGLGIKNLNCFNQALLCKWKWRGLCDHNTLWTKLLEHRYGSLADNVLRDTTRDVKGQSLWWRDIMMIGGIENDAWFRFNVRNVLACELANLLTGIQPSLECADRRRWGLTQTGMFSVKSTYEFLQSREVVVAIEDNVVKALQLLWLNDVPSKVSIFGWRTGGIISFAL